MKKTTLLYLASLLLTLMWTSGHAQTYCAASSTDASLENITNVTYASINNTTTSHAGYTDFTFQMASVAPGDTDQISVEIKADLNEYIYVFIDWNQNGVLDDAGEVYTLASSTPSKAPTR